MAEISSISRVGTTEPFELQASRGQIYKHTTLFKYGYNPLIINANETVWDGGGIYQYPASASTIAVASSAGATDSGKTGKLVGLDANYEEIEEDFTLDGSGTYTTTKSFLRTYRAYITGSSSPTGNITFKIGAVTHAQITAGENQTLMAVYTVPAGKTLYVEQGVATHGTDTAGAYMTVRFCVREQGGVFRTATKLDVIGSAITFPFKYPIKITEKSDVEVRAICSKNQNNSLSAIFEGILVNNS
jgi:hypothetical protein